MQKVETRGREVKKRRAWSSEELGAFLDRRPSTRADYRPAIYLLAWTGLRKDELQRLRWGDVNLHSETPTLTIEAEHIKNRQRTTLPILGSVADYLKAMQPPAAAEEDLVLPFRIPAAERLQKDLKRAGIAFRNGFGDLDFHSLRHSFGTWLTANGVTQREIQALMRHSDANLTSNRYTDVSKLPIAASLRTLSEKITASQNGENCTRERSFSADFRGPELTQADKNEEDLVTEKFLIYKG